MKVTREQIIDRVVDLQYERSDFGFNRGTFRVRGDSIDIYPAYLDEGLRIEIDGGEIKKIMTINTITGSSVVSHKSYALYPAKHFMTHPADYEYVFKEIRKDLGYRIK